VKKAAERKKTKSVGLSAGTGAGSLSQEDPLLEGRLQELLGVAMRAGASDAKVISSADVVLDPRVRLKCLIPRCSAAGTCVHCPPDGLPLQETAAVISRYRKGIFFRVVVESELVSGPVVSEAIARKGAGQNRAALMLLGAYYLLVLQIAALLERRARQWGYEPSGYGAGTCRDVLCLFQPHCRALLTTRGCRHPDLSRPSMESCGMDVYTMGANVGWDIYPVGGSVRPEDVPKGSLMGLVLVA
jgi:predicted metal-binding protein